MDLEILHAGSEELPASKELVKRVFMTFEAPDYAEEGIEHFLHYVDVELDQELTENKLVIWCAKADGKIVGILAVRLPDHLALLFVDEAYQRQGIAGKLFQTMFYELTPVELSVNSSPYAIPIYEKLGFEKTGTEEIVSGIRFQPMRYQR